jgi:hypothetical protein
MLAKVREHLIVPLMSRLGTALATAIAPFLGVPDWRIQLAIGLTQLGLIVFDLVADYLHRRFVANEMFHRTVSTILDGDGR